MSVCTFIAADIPLQEVTPAKEYQVHIDLDKGIIEDGGADDNFYLLSFPDVQDYSDKMKKVISIIAIVAGVLVLLSVVAPMIIGAVLEAQVVSSVGIIGGADGPTSVMVTGVTRVGSAITEVVVGALLIVAGIWSVRKSKK